jgi:hypothetical protein
VEGRPESWASGSEPASGWRAVSESVIALRLLPVA